MAEHHDGRCTGAVVGGREVAAEQRLDPEQAKGVRGDARAEEALGRHARVADVHCRLVVGRHVLEARGRGTPVLEVEIRDALLAAVGVACGQRHDALRIVHRQAADQDGVVHGECRAGEAEAEPEGKNRGRREPAFPDQQAHREPQVLPRLIEPPRAVCVAARLLDLIEATELEAGAPAGLPRRQSGPDVVGHLPLDVVAQLGV